MLGFILSIVFAIVFFVSARKYGATPWKWAGFAFIAFNAFFYIGLVALKITAIAVFGNSSASPDTVMAINVVAIISLYSLSILFILSQLKRLKRNVQITRVTQEEKSATEKGSNY